MPSNPTHLDGRGGASDAGIATGEIPHTRASVAINTDALRNCERDWHAKRGRLDTILDTLSLRGVRHG